MLFYSCLLNFLVLLFYSSVTEDVAWLYCHISVDVQDLMSFNIKTNFIFFSF